MVEAEGLAEDGAEVAVEEGEDVLVGIPRGSGSRAEDAVEFLLEQGLGRGVEGQEEEGEGECRGGRIEVGHDIEEHVSEDLCFDERADAIAGGRGVAGDYERLWCFLSAIRFRGQYSRRP